MQAREFADAKCASACAAVATGAAAPIGRAASPIGRVTASVLEFVMVGGPLTIAGAATPP
jgi:hypothetical protein